MEEVCKRLAVKVLEEVKSEKADVKMRKWKGL
jgi:hypothetical protein